jgi:hypothetical protein
MQHAGTIQMIGVEKVIVVIADQREIVDGLPPFVKDEFEAYLDWSILEACEA